MFDTRDAIKNLSMDFVYIPEGSEDFKSVRIEADTEGDKLKLTINSSIEIKNVDLENIITGVQRDTLKKMKLSAKDDCVFYLKNTDRIYAVELAADALKIENLKPVDM